MTPYTNDETCIRTAYRIGDTSRFVKGLIRRHKLHVLVTSQGRSPFRIHE